MSETKKIFVERETYELKGKTYFSYFVKGIVRGKEIKASVKPADFNGYTVLDIVFDNSNKAELIVKPYEIVDEATKNVIKGNTYVVQSIDENGDIYECPVKHNRASDKALLQMLIR